MSHFLSWRVSLVIGMGFIDYGHTLIGWMYLVPDYWSLNDSWLLDYDGGGLHVKLIFINYDNGH
jgi:hypothetical protein